MTSFIKYEFSFALVCLLLAGVACTKKNLDFVAPISPNFHSASLINKAWKLSQYIIITDKQEYIFTGNDIAGHALKRLEFSYMGNYSASSASWSGTYSFFNDSTKIFLKPDDPVVISLLLNIDHLSPQIMVISTAVVNCNQQIPETSDFEKFVVNHSKIWLYTRGIEVSNLKSVKIKFVYSSR